MLAVLLIQGDWDLLLVIISKMANDSTNGTNATAREKCLADHRKKLLEHRELEAKLKKSK